MALAALLMGSGASAQVSYSINFDANATGWTGNFARFTGATACGGSGGAMRRNLYSAVTTGQLISPSTGTSAGGSTTISYSYKVANWSANTAATATPWGSFDVQYGATATGPWTTIATVSNETQLGNPCISKSHTFSPPAGGLFIRWSATFSGSGDYYLNFDNVVVAEALPSCSGVPNAGSVTSPVTVCSGSTTVLTAIGLTSNASPGISYQWEESPDGSTGWASVVGGTGATTANYTTTAVTATRYFRLRSNCSNGPATNVSNVVTVNVFAVSSSENFSSGNLTANCWTPSGTGFPANINYNALSAFGVGTGSIRYNFYSATGGQTLIYTSPVFTALGADQNMTFDVAGATYATEADQITLQESNDGGATWTNVQVMTNEVGGLLNTGGASLSLFVPTAAQWISRSYPLSAGTNRVRFNGVSAFGNAVYLDNLAIAATPTCFAPSGITVDGLTSTTAELSWTDANSPASIGYEWEIRSSGAAGSGATGREDNGSGPGTTASAVGLVASTNYVFYVRADCGQAEPGPWSGGTPLFTAYCPASGAVFGTNQLGLNNVTFANINNNSTSLGGYEDLTAVVANVVPGESYPLTITRTQPFTSDQLFAWIDWNGDLDFNDANEAVLVSIVTPANPTVINVTVPPGTLGGNVRMRIRRHNITAGFAGNVTPCGNSDLGMVQDFTISICGAPTATATVTGEDCVAQTFEVTVTVTDLAGAASGEVLYSLGGVAQTPIAFLEADVPFSTVIPGIAVGTVVTASVETVLGCSSDLGEPFSSCDIELDCASPAIVQSHCYETNDTRTWTYVNTEVGGTVDLKFLSGTMDDNDQFLFWEGAVGGTAVTLTPSLTGALTGSGVISVGEVLSVSIATDGTGSCADGGFGGITWQVRCGGCTEPAGFLTVEEGDLGFPAIDCSVPPGSFNPHVGIEDTGIDENTGLPPATVGYRLFVNGVPQTDVTGLPGGEFYDLGTYPLNTTIGVILLHEDQVGQSACNNTLSTNFTVPFSACPPAGDDCADAAVAPIVAIVDCPGNAITATTIGASQTGAQPGCAGGAVQDVWYSINTAGFGAVGLSISAGTSSIVGVELYSACDGASLGCFPNGIASGPFTLNVSGEYLWRFFTTAGNHGSFNICFSADVAADGNDCSNPIDLSLETSPYSGTTVSTTVSNSFSIVCGSALANNARDLVHFIDVANGSTLTIINTSGYDSQVVVQYGDVCPGDQVISCVDDPNSGTTTWFNETGDTQRVWFIQDGFGTAAGTYTLSWSVINCVAPVASRTPTDDCDGNTFSIDVDLTSIGSATEVDIVPTVGTAQTGISAAGVYTFGPYAFGTQVGFSIQHNLDGDCDVTLAPITSFGNSCPAVLVPFTGSNIVACGTNVLLRDHANTANYDNNADGFTVLENGGASVITITGNYGTEACCDRLRIYDGVGTGGTELANLAGTGTINFTSAPGQTVTVRFTSDGSVVNFGFNAVVTYTGPCVVACTLPEATAAVAADDCGTGEFTIDVDLTSLGSATSVNIVPSSGTAQNDIEAPGVYTFGPYAFNTVVSFVVEHVQDGDCDLPLAGVTSLGVNCPVSNPSACGLARAIPDNGCGTEIFLEQEIAVTGVSSSLGSNVALSSVDLIVSHTWNGDMRISLVSPNGVEVPLVTERFGSGDNLGNPASCPGSVLRLQAGGTALNNTATNNVVGVFAPEAPLTGFNDGSDPNGNWTLRICDAFGGDVGALQYVALNFEELTCVAPTATASVQFDCDNGEFSIAVNVTSLGTALDLSITPTVGTALTAVDAAGTYVFGPYALGTPVSVSVVNNQDASCALSFGPFAPVLADCPVPNPSACGLARAIPDNGCATSNFLEVNVEVSGQGNALGTNVALSSVDLIVSHTWNSDMRISLVSPNGVTRNLVTGRGGSGANFGNPANCPTAVLKLQDGGAAITGITGNNVTGVFNPEQSLAGFSDGSDANGVWKLRICDSFTGDVGALQYVALNFLDCVPPAATRTVVPNCASGEFFVDVNVTSLGSASSVGIIANGNLAATAVATGVVQIGPFASGSTVTLSLAHDSNPLCDLNLASVTFTCPPANNDCVDAIPVGCNSNTAGTTVNGTTTGAPGFCGTGLGTAPGVWYTVQGWGGPMTASLCGAGFDTKIGIFTGSCGAFTCITGNDDFCGLQSQVTWASVNGTTYYIYVTAFGTTATGAFDLTVSCGSTAPTCDANGLSLEFQTDATPAQNTWEIRNGAGTVVAIGGGPLVAPSGIQTQALCLPDGCYTLRVFDSAGDGITNGGYTLRQAGPASLDTRIIDNFRNFSTGGLSAIGNGPSAFCLPMSTQKPIFVARDKMDWVNAQYFVSEPDEDVSAQWQVGDQTISGYQFWFFDPNGTYSFRRGRTHATSDGFGPANEFRACHMRINNWAVANQIPANVLMNVRIRARVAGVYKDFGPAYRFMIDPVAAACPLTKLNDIPNQPALSCNQTRNWGPGNFVHARQVSGANRYQFRFRIPAEGYIKVVTSNTYFQQLNWASAPLEAGKTYEVQVRASKDGGATWCASGAVWGESCTLTINTPAQGDEQNLGMGNGSTSGLALWPNPNRGDQLWIDLSGIEAGVETVSVDIMDMTGKQIVARILPTQGDRLNTVLNLNGDLATGMYLVNITAGGKRYTERLVIAN